MLLGTKHTKAARALMREAALGRRMKHTAAAKKKISETMAARAKYVAKLIAADKAAE